MTFEEWVKKNWMYADDLHDAKEIWDAAQKHLIPDGWELVPVRPTTEMWLAGQYKATYLNNNVTMCLSGQQVEAIYAAMLAAKDE